jgi:hypothetical protein
MMSETKALGFFFFLLRGARNDGGRLLEAVTWYSDRCAFGEMGRGKSKIAVVVVVR